MIVVDACALIAHGDREDSCHDRAVAAFADVAGYGLAISTVTLGEALARYARTGHVDQAHRAMLGLGLTVLAVPDSASVQLAELRATTRLPMPDCCVLHAARQCEADGIVTFDDRLAKSARALGMIVMDGRT